VSRRDAIRMSDAEVRAFLQEQKTVIVGTNGRDGWPHLMPLWYVLRGEAALWGWTYAASQKVRNLERDPRCTLQVEAGTEYRELRGVMVKAECILHRDIELVVGIGAELAQRYGGGDLTPEVSAAMRKQAAKRVGLEFVARDVATWDHRKLGGTY
jgi:hypothetical protein